MVDLFFWLIQNDEEKGYNPERIGQIENLDALLQMLELHQEQTTFAVFKGNIEPRQEAEENRILLTHAFRDADFNILEFMKLCWDMHLFDRDSVNGIYRNNIKVSIWLNRPDRIKVFEKLGLRAAYIQVKHTPDVTTLDRQWTISFFNSDAFKVNNEIINEHDQQGSTNSEEKIVRWIKKHFHFRNDGNGVLLTSNILEENQWRVHHFINRFVSATIKIGLELANIIWAEFALDLTLKIFPQVPNIYLAYVYYHDDTFEIGVYLTGKEEEIYIHIKTMSSGSPPIDEFMENEQKKEDKERTKVQAQQDRHQPIKDKTEDDEPKVEEISKVIDNLPDK